jgi:Flp pilus assembly protein TadG
MAEFALLLFPLTVFLLGTVDFCRAFYAYNVINNAARNAAVWQSDPNHPYYADLTHAAQGDASGLSFKDVTLETTNDANNNPEYYTVTVSYDFMMFTSFLFGGNTITMARSVTMKAIPSAPS